MIFYPQRPKNVFAYSKRNVHLCIIKEKTNTLRNTTQKICSWDYNLLSASRPNYVFLKIIGMAELV